MNVRRSIIAGLVFTVLICGFFPLHVLKIEAPRQNSTVYLRPIRPADRLVIGFIHSVEHCPVRDYFEIDRDYRLVLRETTFASMNTGLPFVRGPNETLANEGAQFRLGNRHIVFSTIELWVNKHYGNMIRFGEEKELLLPSLAGDTLLRISTTRTAALRYAAWKVLFMLRPFQQGGKRWRVL